MPPIDRAGRAIAGLLTYDPGPGIYSRLERAIEQMPENVRVQELPGLLRRYKEGVPGWELKATDLDSVIAGRDVVPREELLLRVRERSPVYTHKEVVLTDGGPTGPATGPFSNPGKIVPSYQEEASALGQGIKHGNPMYNNLHGQDFSQGGDDYTEILIAQPGAREGDYGNHWENAPVAYTDANKDAVAHARFDVHDGFLRVNELQSDLGIHNRKMREALDKRAPRGEGDYPLPFPLEDTATELLLKRLNLYAARAGLKGVEIASPRAIADKVGGDIGNYEHAYGKVAVGQQKRLGRKMGGMESAPILEPDTNTFSQLPYNAGEAVRAVDNATWALEASADRYRGDIDQRSAFPEVEAVVNAMDFGENPIPYAELLQRRMVAQAVKRGVLPRVAQDMVNRDMPEIMREAENVLYLRKRRRNLANEHRWWSARPQPPATARPPIYRGVMSDEMRRRLIQQGVGASVLAPLLMQEDR